MDTISKQFGAIQSHPWSSSTLPNCCMQAPHVFSGISSSKPSLPDSIPSGISGQSAMTQRKDRRGAREMGPHQPNRLELSKHMEQWRFAHSVQAPQLLNIKIIRYNMSPIEEWIVDDPRQTLKTPSNGLEKPVQHYVFKSLDCWAL